MKERTTLILLSILFTIIFMVSNIVIEICFYGNLFNNNNSKIIEIIVRLSFAILIIVFSIIATIKVSKKISEKEQIEKQLAKEQEMLQKYFDISDFIIIMIDKDLKIKLINKKGCEIFEYKEKEIIGKDFKTFLPNIAKDDFSKMTNELFTNIKNKVNHYETPIITKTGERKIIEWKIQILSDYNNEEIEIILGSGEDITERKQAEEELHYKANILRHISEAVVSIDISGKITSWNAAAEKIYNYKEKEVIGKFLVDILPFKDIKEILKECYEKGLWKGEILQYQKDEIPINIFSSIALILDNKQNPLGAVLINRDISEQKIMEQELKESEERYRLMAETAKDIIIIHNINGRITYFNQSSIDTLGYDNETLSEMYIDDLIPPNNALYMKLLKKHREEGDKSQYLYETEFITKDKEIIPIEINSSPLVRNDKPISIFLIARNITDRKKASDLLKKERDKVQNYLNAAEVMLIALNKNGEVTLINRKGCSITGYSEEEIIGKNWFDTIALDKTTNTLLKQLLKNNKENIIEYMESPIITKTRQKRIIAWRNTFLIDKDKNITGLLSSGEDITERKKTEEALKLNEARLRTLHRLNRMIDDPRERMEKFVIEEAIKLTKSSFGYLGFMNHQETKLTHRIMSNIIIDANIKNKEFINVKESKLLIELVEKRVPIIVNETSEYEENQYKVEGIKTEIKRFIITPIFNKATMIAIASIGNKEESYNELDVQQFQLLLDGLFLAIQNKEANEQIRESLVEKEILLKEVHHRVKNNLQVVYSMLNLQSKLIKDKNIITIFKESQNRIKTMALIHENLYQSKSLENINFTEYITYLVNNLFISYNISQEVVVLKTDIDDNMKLSINQAISCGLVLNELVSNALKYAFPDEKKGEIFIGLSEKDKMFKLVFSDNGIGIPKDINIKNTTTLGLSLVSALINQLRGTIEIKRQSGTKFIITFSEKASKNE